MQAEISSDGKHVWVNSPDGMCIGRFGRAIVDVHHDTTGQSAGKHCLACKPRTADLDADWKFFVENMALHHRVDVGVEHKPVDTSR